MGEILRIMNYNDDVILEGYRVQLQRSLNLGTISAEEYHRILNKIKLLFGDYPYLEKKRSLEIV